MRMLVVGERMNRATWRPRGWPDVDPDRYWRLALRVGAFRDARSTAKLAALGLAGAARANLLPPDPQGVSWDHEEARRVAASWLPRLAGYDLALLAGRRVAEAFGLGRVSAGLLVREGGARMVVVPHPSGLNHFWNDPRDAEEMREKLSRVMRRLGCRE